MPSSSRRGPAAQRPPHRRLAVLSVALIAVLSTVTPFVAVSAVAAPSGSPTPASVAAVPHENTTGGNLTVLVGSSASYEALDTVGDVATAHRTGALASDDEVRVGDTLVLSFTSRRLGAEYGDTTGPNATVRFFESLEQTNATLNVTSVSGTDCEPLRVDLRESRHRVLVNDTQGAFRVLLDTEGLVADGGCDGRLDVPGGYEVALGRSTADGSSRQTALFDLLDRPGGSEPEPDPEGRIAVYRAAPSLAGDLRSAGELRRGILAERLEQSEMVVSEEVAVLRLRSARLDRAYANATGVNATQRFLRAVNATGGRFAVPVARTGDIERTDVGTETEPGSAESPGLSLPGPGVSTVTDRENDTFYLVVDTGRARLRDGNRTAPLTADPETYLRPSLSVPGGDPERYAGRLVLESPDGTVAVARNASVEGARQLAVVGTDGTFVARTRSNLATGTELTLRVRSGNETLARRAVTAERATTLDGTVDQPDASFDLGPQPAGRILNLTLARNGTTFHRMPVLVGAQPTLRDVTVRRLGRGPEGPTVRFEVTARFPRSGYVVVRNRSGRYVGFPVPAGEPVRVNGTVPIRPGDGERGRPIQLIAVYDSNHNGEFDGPRGEGAVDMPFRADDGGLLTRSVRLPPASPTPTVTAPPPGTTVAVTDGQPGFGPLVALLGVLGLVCLLGARRDRGGPS